MKKIFLSIVFVFASFAMVNANSNIETIENSNSIDIAEGTPSDCVRTSRNATIAIARAFDWDISSGGSELEFALDVYMVIYQDCLDN